MSAAPGVAVVPAADHIGFWRGAETVTLGGLGEGVVAALGQLAGGGARDDDLVENAARAGGAEALADLYYSFGVLGRRRLLSLSVRLEGDPLATLVPTSAPLELGWRRVDDDRRYALSRFALLRAGGGELLLESPLSPGRVVLHDPRAAMLVHALARPRRPLEAAWPTGLPPAAVALLVQLLLEAAMLADLERAASLEAWEFHDLLFHVRSRGGRHDAPLGSVFPLAGRRPPPPAHRPPFPGAERVALARPDLGRLRQTDPPFARLQDERRSVREYGVRPISAAQLGEFLYRTARVTERTENVVQTPAGPVPIDVARRPFPAGGALYELELYPVVRSCGGVAPGLYHYDPHDHCLERLSGPLDVVDELLADAARAAGIPPDRLQVLFVVSARFPRVFWKYAGMGYAMILKNLGCLYQTMYLAAAAMGLAPCAIGGGDAARFAKATSNDLYEEGSVGEFLLGSAAGPELRDAHG